MQLKLLSIVNTYFVNNYTYWDGAADCYFKSIICMQKRVIRYFCHGPDLTTTNPLFKKPDELKLNDVYKLQICKLMCSTI